MNLTLHKALVLRQAGLSLVELMISMVVALILIAGASQIYLTTKRTYNAQAELARMQENIRFAMDLITTDLRRSGYWGGNVDTASMVSRVDPSATLCSDDSWARMVAWRVAGLDNAEAAADFTCATRIPGTDILTVRFAGPNTVAEASIGPTEANAWFLRSTLFEGELIRGSEKGSTSLPIPPGTPPPEHLLPEIRRLVSNTYYIANSQQSCNGSPIPALWRVRLANGGGLVTEELAPGIEQMQIRYLENDAYVDAQDIERWPEVEAVRVWLLARSDCPELGLDNATSYELGNVPNWPATPDNFRRQLYVATVMLRNTLVR